MKTTSTYSFNYEVPVSRTQLLPILDAAISVGEYRFVRQSALSWLAAFPGDLGLNLIYSKALFGEGKNQYAIPILESMVKLDPEFEEAQELKMMVDQVNNSDSTATDMAAYFILTGKTQTGFTVPDWAKLALDARLCYEKGELDDAEDLVQQAIMLEPGSVLPAVTHLRILYSRKDNQALKSLSLLYHNRWPEALQFSLLLAVAGMQDGNDSESVALLHKVVTQDASGQVAIRVLGENHAYKALWPSKMEMRFSQSVPSSVASALGWNLLDAGEISVSTAASVTSSEDDGVSTGTSAASTAAPVTAAAASNSFSTSTTTAPVAPPVSSPVSSSSSTASTGASAPASSTPSSTPSAASASTVSAEQAEDSKEEMLNIQDALDKVAQRIHAPGVGRVDGRFPVYVIFSSKQGLSKQYGDQSASLIDEQLKLLAEAIRKHQGWSSLLYYADDATCTSALGLQTSAIDPWKLKLSLKDLDAALAKKGEMIGALLIVGGPEIIPFHNLPNPTDDSDADIPSDNPYSTLDDNYFIPEWPVGRAPGGADHKPDMLMKSIKSMIVFHNNYQPAQPWWQSVSFFAPIWQRMQSVLPMTHSPLIAKPSFGYTAAVWKQASIEVFRPIGETQALLSSPPGKTGQINNSGYLPAKLAYFNLHGLSDSAYWYGQPKSDEQDGTPEYPVALSPADLDGNTTIPNVIFSEACYGTYINNKGVNDAISLKFMDMGAHAVVGSTRIAYGSIAAPLIGADLLGVNFWKLMKDGVTAGEALRTAKVNLAQDMTKRQGFLDGEDQKTLISFVLYGDPLYTLPSSPKLAKAAYRIRSMLPEFSLSHSYAEPKDMQSVSTEAISQVKLIVEQYLPGLRDGEYHVTRQHAEYKNQAPKKQGFLNRKKSPGYLSTTQTVVTVSKNIKTDHEHREFARFTFDEAGKVIKLAISH
jgi:tetratricopeptide (TPR) repeat protein